MELKLKDPRDQKIAELERELAVYQGFTISHMIALDTERVVTFAPGAEYQAAHKIRLILKREVIDEQNALVAELIIQKNKEH